MHLLLKQKAGPHGKQTGINTPGATESQLNFAYYSKTEETPKVKIATKADMSDAKEVEGKQTQAVAIEGVQYYSNKASVNDLKENTTYY